ncbi:ThuA domain-containing protein [Sphingomonas sp. BIUV-7]|uniref:ThuA domain-containing protein n=1 Tax=Sphingomonas natans TaxID=3063330 RepID=A0ABT8YB61_9SPHN|nr:ThuA domain-containing protein [Sphingomonas sp. BIUV-7]MDO6415568.1 ThuA domain-containing protein [Sphingomonas sp. BIUV-7]
MRIGSTMRAALAGLAALGGGMASAQAPAPQGAAPLPGTYAPGRRMLGYEDPYAGKKRVLLVADLHTGNQNAHDAVSHAMATLERITRAAGIVLYIRTDTEWVTKDEVWGTGDYAKGGRRQAKGRNLKDFDAIVFYTNGDLDLTDRQKADLLSFVHDDGKGFVGIHTATATASKWPEYGEMIGGYFDNHPWGISDAKIIVERPDAPEMKLYLKSPIVKDEHYQMLAPYDRAKVDVLARIDTSSVDMTSPNVHRTDKDFPVAWIKSYGTGRVFYSGLGHSDASWDDPRQQNMFLEAIKWAAHVTDYPVRPHPLPVK